MNHLRALTSMLRATRDEFLGLYREYEAAWVGLATNTTPADRSAAVDAIREVYRQLGRDEKALFLWFDSLPAMELGHRTLLAGEASHCLCNALRWHLAPGITATLSDAPAPAWTALLGAASLEEFRTDRSLKDSLESFLRTFAGQAGRQVSFAQLERGSPFAPITPELAERQVSLPTIAHAWFCHHVFSATDRPCDKNPYVDLSPGERSPAAAPGEGGRVRVPLPARAEPQAPSPQPSPRGRGRMAPSCREGDERGSDSLLAACVAAAHNCLWWCPFESAVLLCDRPAEVHLKEGRLHRDGGPAARWRDGLLTWALNGVIVPQEVVETPGERLDARLVPEEINAEVRREIVRKIGIERICRDLGATTLDRQGDYELLLVPLFDDWPTPYLKMLNPSTGTYHIEGVPPECATVAEALEWRNGTEELPTALT